MDVQINLPQAMSFYSGNDYSHFVVMASNILESETDCENPEPNALSVSVFNLNHND